MKASAEQKARKKALRKEKLNKRITEIDALRGLAVFLMVFDHFMYDVFALMPSIFGGYKTDGFWYGFAKIARSYWSWYIRVDVRLFVLFVFLSLTGISCSLSRSNMKRGLKLAGLALALTIGTVAVDFIAGLKGGMVIVFGILHLIALCLIIIALIEKLTANKWVYLIIGIVMVVVGLVIADPVAVLEYSVDYNNFFPLFWEGFIGKILLGPDCYSFFFYGGQVFIGVFMGKLLYPERKSIISDKGYSDNFLTFAGRNTLLVYVAHQLLIPVVLGIILLICGYTISF